MQIVKGTGYFPVREFDTVRDMLTQSVALYRDLPAFRFRNTPSEDPQTRTYGEFDRDVKALGTALRAAGLADTRLAVVGENSYEWCVAHAAVISGVGVVVPLDRLLPAEEVERLLDRGEVEAVLCDPSYLADLQAAAARLPKLRTLICLRPGKAGPEWDAAYAAPAPDLLSSRRDGEAPVLSATALTDWGQELRDAGDLSFDSVDLDPNVLMALLFTSGTTSTSKAVMLSHANVCADIRGVAGVVQLWPGVKMQSVLPLHHTFENTCGLYMALYYGGVIHETDGLRYLQKNLQEYKIDMLIGVPLLFENFYNKVMDALRTQKKEKLVRRLIPVTNALRKVGIDLRRLAYKRIMEAFGGQLQLGICGAAPIDPEIIRFFDAVGLRILQGYGLTETSPVAAGCNSKVFVPGTVGHPVAGVEVAVDTDVPGEPEEILVRGGNVMLGYYMNPEATEEVLDADGWLHTGDMGIIDPKSNCLTITGRKKSMIVLGSGKKVFPEELEQMLGQAGFVKESLVWGDTDESGDVVISAKLVLDREKFLREDGSEPDEHTIRQQLEDLIAEINSRLPSFKGIRQYVFSFRDMVKTTTMKVRWPIEIEKIRSLMERNKLRWRELTGRNVDPYEDDDTSEEDSTGSRGGNS